MDLQYLDQLALINQIKGEEFKIGDDWLMRFHNRNRVSDISKIKRLIFEEGHKIIEM